MRASTDVSSEMITPLVDVRGVGKVYGKHRVLQEVGISVGAGEVVGLVGPNGAGKSTLLRILTGMSEPTDGEGTVLGKSIRGRGGDVPFVGMMIERPAFIESISARLNLRLLFGIRGGVDNDSIDALLRRVGLDPDNGRPVRSYSLGMRQRLSLAQAIGEHPTLVILDEPTNGLDPSGILEMRTVVRCLADDQNMGVILASHLLGEVEAVCDRVVLLDHGRVAGTYIPQAVRERDAVLEVSLPEDIERALTVPSVRLLQKVSSRSIRVSLSVPMPEAVKALVEANVAVEGICRVTAGLERAYVEAVTK